MDTPSTWWTEDFVDLTSFTTTVVDERVQPQLSSVAGESDVNPPMKMDEITLMDVPDVPTFAWLEEVDNAPLTKGGANGLTTITGINSVRKQQYPLQLNIGGKVVNQGSPLTPVSNFRKPTTNSSLVERRDAQLKLDLTLATTEASHLSTNSPQSIILTSQVPAAKKELNLTTPDILGPLTDKNSEFNLLAYVFEEDKFSNDGDAKNINVLNTPEIKPEQLDMPPQFTPEVDSTTTSPVGWIKEEPKEKEETVAKPSKNVKETKVTSTTNTTEVLKKVMPTKRRSSKQKEKVAVVEPRIKIELDEYRPVIYRHMSNSLSDDILFPTKKRKISTASEDSSYTEDKYRELRDKNNEASRRSRMNRKSREVEMKQQADHLENTNTKLKAKADELQKLVERLRATLMEVMVRKV